MGKEGNERYIRSKGQRERKGGRERGRDQGVRKVQDSRHSNSLLYSEVELWEGSRVRGGKR